MYGLVPQSRLTTNDTNKRILLRIALAKRLLLNLLTRYVATRIDKTIGKSSPIRPLFT